MTDTIGRPSDVAPTVITTLCAVAWVTLAVFCGAPALFAVDAEVRPDKAGVPTLFVNGRELTSLMCVTEDPSARIWVENGELHLVCESLYRGAGIETLADIPKDCTVTCDVAFDSWLSDDASAGFSLLRGSGSFVCNLAYYGSGNRLKFWDRNAGGEGLIRFDQSLDWEAGRFYTLRLVVDGRSLRAFVDGRLVGEGESPVQSPAGPLRLGVYRGKARIRNLTVTTHEGEVAFREPFDNPDLPAWDARSGSDFQLIQEAARRGIELFQIGFHLTECWQAPNEFDVDRLGARVTTAREAGPDAWFVVRLWLRPPGFWVKQHQEHMVQGQDIDGVPAQPRRWVTFSSEAWRRDVTAALREMVRKIDAEPWSERIVGFQVMAAHGGEWVYDFSRNDFHDYSTCQKQAFKRWLKQRYEDSSQTLKMAWQNPEVDVETAAIPSPRQRCFPLDWAAFRGIRGEGREVVTPDAALVAGRTSDLFLDPERDRAVLDYLEFHNEAVVKTMLACCRALKQSERSRRVTGVYYGYHVPTTNSIHNKGHSAVKRALEAPEVDMFACPLNYDQRDPGGTTLPQLAAASFRQAGKLFWLEDDSRTVYARPGTRWRIETVSDTLEVMKRNFAYALTQGGGEWWLDFGQGWFAHPPILDLYRQFVTIRKQASGPDRVSSAEIVVVLCERTYRHLFRKPTFCEHLVYRQLLEEMSRVGTPFDIAMLANLADLKPYRLYIFPDAFCLSRDERETVRDVTRRDGRTALWIAYPGVWSENGLSTERMTDLTGMAHVLRPIRSTPALYLDGDVSRWTAGLPGDTRFESPVALCPVPVVDDAKAQLLGRLQLRFPQTVAGNGAPPQDRPVGLAVREFADWNSIFCSLPDIPAHLLRTLAKAAGVHIYCHYGDTVFASKGFIAIHAARDGERTLHLPATNARLEEVFDGTQPEVIDGRAQLQLRRGETRLWRLETTRE